MKEKEKLIEYVINNFDKFEKNVKTLTPFERCLVYIILLEIAVSLED
jgi:hypothetical protein